MVGEVGCLLFDAEGSGEGFVARFGIEPAPGQALLPQGCGAALARGVARAELAVLRLLAERQRLTPHQALLEGKRFYLRGPRALERGLASGGAFVVDGASLGAAAAIALFSLYTELPVPAATFVTGEVTAEGAVVAVDRTTAKVEAVLREHPEARRVLIPAASAEEVARATLSSSIVVGCPTLEQLLAEVFGHQALLALPASAVDIEGTVRKGCELYAKLQSYQAAEELLGVALHAIERRREATGDGTAYQREEFVCLWRRGSALVHQGRLEEADATLALGATLGEELWQAELLDPRDYLGFRGNLAVLLRDRYRFDEAAALLEQTLALQRALRQGKRERARTLGNLGELLTFAGDFDRAEAALLRSRDHLEQAYPDELPRALCYLGNLALRQGQLDRAIDRYEEGLAANHVVTCGGEANAGFLTYGMVRALVRLGQHQRALARADEALARLPDHQPYPRQLLLAQRGLAALATGERDEGEANLRAAAELTFVSGSLLRFGVTRALGELACHLLTADPRAHREEIARHAQAVLESARAVPGLDEEPRAELLAALERSLAEPLQLGLVAAPLREVIELFLY